MSDERELLDLPLFPLNTILFPGGQIPLHIFEPRYRAMIGRCLDENLPFGIVLIDEGHEVGAPAKPYTVGTVASIAQIERLDDGRYNLIAVGLKRFRILREIPGTPYLQAQVELFTDADTAPVPEATVAELTALFANYVDRLRELSQNKLDPIDLPSDSEDLGWFIAATLPVPLSEKQQLLEIDRLDERLAAEAEILRRELLFLTRWGAMTIEDRNRLLMKRRSWN
ncbi:MAG: LON peptidase substrate-binding domain-containing protein [Dehalococcoidia bacterium]|nr:LON peptidase substrate-binding domain-containing protein [Dehalococcoidia bacterium]